MTNALATTNITSMNESDALIEIRKHPEIYPHFNSFKNTDKLARLQAIIIKCYQIRHIKDTSFIGPDSMDLMEQIEKDKRYRDMSFEEIKTAFTNGAFEKYGECYGLTTPFFLKCLDSYIEANRQSYIESVRQQELLKRKAYDDKLTENIKMRLEESKHRAAIERAAKELVLNSKVEKA